MGLSDNTRSSSSPDNPKYKLPRKRRFIERSHSKSGNIHHKEDKPRIKVKLSFLSKLKLKLFPERAFFVTMLFKNGTSKSFIIASSNRTFKFRGKTYMIDYEESWFDISLNNYHLYYHEDSAVPINREIELIGDENYFSVKPDNLKPLIKMEYIKALAESQTLSKYLKLALMFSAIAVFQLVIVIFMVYKISKGLGIKVW